MFKAVIDAEKLKEALEAVSTLVDEAKFRLTPEQLSVRAVDPANVAMVSLELDREAFDSFQASEGELGIDLTKLTDILQMADKTDKIELEVDEEAHKLAVRMSGLSYTVSLLDPSSIRKEPKVPNLELPARVVMRGEELRRAIKASEKVGEYMSMSVTQDAFILEAEGDTDKVRLEIPRDQLIELHPGEARSLFSLDYLGDISKVLAKTDEVELEIGKDYPIKINFTIAEGNGRVGYMLAPRVETD